jgi:hypothetical protein
VLLLPTATLRLMGAVYGIFAVFGACVVSVKFARRAKMKLGLMEADDVNPGDWADQVDKDDL